MDSPYKVPAMRIEFPCHDHGMETLMPATDPIVSITCLVSNKEMFPNSSLQTILCGKSNTYCLHQAGSSLNFRPDALTISVFPTFMSRPQLERQLTLMSTTSVIIHNLA